MHSKLTYFSDVHCRREQLGLIERQGDNVLVVHDMPEGPLLKTVFLIVVSAIPVIAVPAVLATQNVAAVVMVFFVLFASVAVMTQKKRAEIDLADREITVTRKVFALARSKVYPLDNFTAAEIETKARLIEGYTLPFFLVNLGGRRKQITLYSTDNPKEARAVQEELAGFLKKAGISTPGHRSG